MSEVSPTVSSCNSHIKANPKFSSVKRIVPDVRAIHDPLGSERLGQLLFPSCASIAQAPSFSTATTSWWLSPGCWCSLQSTWAAPLPITSPGLSLGTLTLARGDKPRLLSMNPLSTRVTTAAEAVASPMASLGLLYGASLCRSS